ncbi:hypothetical protein PG996_010442 [Apiospora saccharicola]|uniref:Uncharacterized protein n=1 Tax=Apiospora saccharicola TaxID=335842 RepID=A0ABR1UNL7_9PEZI
MHHLDGTPYTRLQRQPLPPIAQARIVDPEDLHLGPELLKLGHGAVELVLEPQRAADVGVGLVQGLVALFQDLAHDGRHVRGVAHAPELVRALHDVVVGREERDGQALELDSVFLRSDQAVPLSEAKGPLLLRRPLPRTLDPQPIGVHGGGSPPVGTVAGPGQDHATDTLIFFTQVVIDTNVSLAARGLITGDTLCHRAEVALGDVRGSILMGLLTIVVVLLVVCNRSGLLGELGERVGSGEEGRDTEAEESGDTEDVESNDSEDPV